MSVAEPTAPGADAKTAAPAPQTKRRPFHKRAMHAIRRAHLYFGLFLLPWAVLYGLTGFLFNHPSAFSDQPTASFGASELRDTPMEKLPKPAALAEQVVADLNERAQGARTYALVEPEKAKYARDLAFVTVKTDTQEVNVLFDLTSASGTVRTKAAPPPAKEIEKAPFALTGAKGGDAKGGGGDAKGAITKGAAPKGGGRGEKGGGEKGGGEKGGGRGERGAPKGETAGQAPTAGAARPRPLTDIGLTIASGFIASASSVQLPEPIFERVRAATPVVLERTGFPGGEITATSVPDLSFRISDGEKVWTASYNTQTGAVSGVPTDAVAPPDELSTRRFLTRLHREHVFPSSMNAKWFWCVVVDVMSFVMVFWGVSGVVMWWQLKATRKLGVVIVLLSVCAAVALGFGMHDLLSPK